MESVTGVVLLAVDDEEDEEDGVDEEELEARETHAEPFQYWLEVQAAVVPVLAAVAADAVVAAVEVTGRTVHPVAYSKTQLFAAVEVGVGR